MKQCPSCNSTNITLFMGGQFGKYECKDCGYVGPFVIEKEIKKGGKMYICEECGFRYKEKKWADKCKDWCKKHKSCNLEIAKHAVKTN